jgi:hypothetical protein
MPILTERPPHTRKPPWGLWVTLGVCLLFLTAAVALLAHPGPLRIGDRKWGVSLETFHPTVNYQAPRQGLNHWRLKVAFGRGYYEGWTFRLGDRYYQVMHD